MDVAHPVAVSLATDGTLPTGRFGERCRSLRVQFPEGRESVFVRHGSERVGRLQSSVPRRVVERVLDCHSRQVGVAFDVLYWKYERYQKDGRGTRGAGLAHPARVPAADIHFEFASSDDEERFLCAYLADARERYRASDYWETGWFWAYRQFDDYDVSPDGELVVLVFKSDPAELVAAESDRWESFGGLDEWELRRWEEREDGFESLLAQQRDVKGEVGGEREYRLILSDTREATVR